MCLYRASFSSLMQNIGMLLIYKLKSKNNRSYLYVHSHFYEVFFLPCTQVSVISRSFMTYFTTYFTDEDSSTSDYFISETCDVYGFGKNSSNQLALGSQDKVQVLSLVPHMADVQMVSYFNQMRLSMCSVTLFRYPAIEWAT